MRAHAGRAEGARASELSTQLCANHDHGAAPIAYRQRVPMCLEDDELAEYLIG